MNLTGWNRNALKLSLLTAVALQLAACSTTRLAYNNLDWLIPWYVDDYFDLRDSQSRYLDREVADLLRWHCSSELPRYVAWIGRVEAMMAASEVSDAAIQARFDELRGAIDRARLRIAPTAVALLGTLDSSQYRQLQTALQEGNRERAEEYLADGPRTQIRARAERLQERLEEWLGALTEAQEKRLLQWADAIQGLTEAWLDNRKRWQQQLLQTLRNRNSERFGPRMGELFRNPEISWTPEYRRIRQHAEHEALTLTRDLFATATPEQRDTLRQRLNVLQNDFQALTCQD
ncbi:DUF6279 family lipoprotein [Marinobacteraceae bacterium S3BR75-40.1]